MTRNGRGFTLAELLMAMFITSIIAVAVAGVSMVLSTANAHSEDRYMAIESVRNTARKIQYDLQGALLITAAADDGSSLLYWAYDENQNGKINLTEMRLLRYEPVDKEVRRYQVVFPDTWSNALRDSQDTEFTLQRSLNLSTMTSHVADSTYSVGRLLAADVQDFQISLSSSSSPPLATLVRIHQTAGRGGQALILRTAASLRADATRYVGVAEGIYVLTMPTGGGGS